MIEGNLEHGLDWWYHLADWAGITFLQKLAKMFRLSPRISQRTEKKVATRAYNKPVGSASERACV